MCCAYAVVQFLRRMWKLFVVHILFGVFCAAQAADLELRCPLFGSGTSTVLECTVQGNSLTSAPCFTPVDYVKLESVVSSIAATAGRSPFPNCESSHPDNLNGRCTRKDNNNVYHYEFTVTVNKNTLTNDTWYRCYVDCAVPTGQPYPFSINTSDACGPPVKFQETEPTPAPFRCAVGCIVPIVLVIVILLVVVIALLCYRKERKVYVGDDREQIRRVDEHAEKLAGSKRALDKIAQEGSCCGISPADLSVGGFRALVDGRPRDDPEQLHVLVSLRFICCCRMEQIVTKVKNFLAENVTPNILRFVPVSEHTQVSRDSLQRIEEQTGTTIYPPAPNRSGGYVIQIERPTVENIERAKEKVEELIKTPNNDAANQQ